LPEIAFVWLLGADNLATLHRWYRWTTLMSVMPIAVFDREPYAYPALASVAARRFADARRFPGELAELATATPPAWCMLRMRTHPAASSAIRAEGRWRSGRAAEAD
jgi:nicotinate-nucleotide adenylyltransferase